MQLAIEAHALGRAAHDESLFPLAGLRPPQIEAGAAQHEQSDAQPAHQLAAEAAGDEKMAMQVVEEADPASHRLLGLEDFQRHRIDQDLQAAGERALRRYATLPLCARLAATGLRALARQARSREAHRGRLAHLRGPAYGNRDAGRIAGGRAGGFDQLGRRAPVAGRLRRRLALAQQALDVVRIDQDGAGNAHHHQRQEKDQTDPEMELLQPVAKAAALRLGTFGHRDLGPRRAGGGWPDGKKISRRPARGRPGW
jgi:hypothetical protein